MDKPNIPKEIVKAALAWFVALLAAALLKALGSGRTLTAAVSGAAGGLAALAVT